MKHRIVNIIANMDIGTPLNLNTLAGTLKNCEYEPEIYSALIYRLENPKISILIHKSGKIIFNGSPKINEINEARDKLFSDLKRIGYDPIDNPIKIQNIVIFVNLSKKIKINDIQNIDQSSFIITSKKNKIIIKNIQPKFTFIIHPAGQCWIVGLNDINQINSVLDLLVNLIECYFSETN